MGWWDEAPQMERQIWFAACAFLLLWGVSTGLARLDSLPTARDSAFVRDIRACGFAPHCTRFKRVWVSDMYSWARRR